MKHNFVAKNAQLLGHSGTICHVVKKGKHVSRSRQKKEWKKDIR